jgi:hypothetical protein
VKAFHNDESIKQKYLKRVEQHRLADELIQGTGWEDGKGCAVGCTLDKYEHAAYETELGIPEWLARVEDTIFEGLTEKEAQGWPERFLSAIHPGADLDKVKTPFLVFILEENLKTLDSLPDQSEFPDVKNAINLAREVTVQMIAAQKAGDEGLLSAAARSAWSAAESARSARSAAADERVWLTPTVSGCV